MQEQEELEGPLENRSCTDILCFLIFGAFLGSMVRKGTVSRDFYICLDENNCRMLIGHAGYCLKAQFLCLETPAQRLAYPRKLTIYTEVVLSHPSWDYLPFKKLGY